MKRITILLTLFICALSCKAQIFPAGVIPIEAMDTYQGDIPDGAYIKDVHHLLDKYEGTWTGSINNKTYKIVIDQTVESRSHRNIKEDILLLRYKITDQSGNVIANTLNLPNDDLSIVYGIRIVDGGTSNEYYTMQYFGEECEHNGIIYLVVDNNNPNQMILGLSVPGGEYPCDNYGSVEQIFPTFENTDGVTLTKQ